MTQPDRDDLEAAIADRYERDHAVFVGRGTTGFTLALEALGIEGEVILPTYACPSMAYAIRYAGATPVFCDVSPWDYNATVETVRERATGETEAVVPIHMFGHPADLPAFREFCADQDLHLIEDACQIVGGDIDGLTPGSVGTTSVVSFGPKKPIDAGGGGAVLVNDPALAADLRERASGLPTLEEEYVEALAEHYRDLYYSIRDLSEIVPEATDLFDPLPDVFRDLYIRGYDEADLPALDSALSGVQEAIETRRRHAEAYQSLIDHPAVTHPEPRGCPVHYRYSIRLPDRQTRDSVVAFLREADIHVSTLYDPPLHSHFDASDSFPTAEQLADRTLNLWVAERVDEDYIERCVGAVLDGIEETESS